MNHEGRVSVIRMRAGRVLRGACLGVAVSAAAFAQETGETIRSAGQIVAALEGKDGSSAANGAKTRGINVVPKVTSTGHAVATASPLVSMNNIRFDLDSAALTAPSKRQLDEVAAALNTPNLREYRVSVEGHTCNLGSREHNQALSEARAASVREYLASKGVDAARIQTRGWGASRPVAANSTETSRMCNRRVDVIRLEKAVMLAMNLEERAPAASTRGGGAGFVAAEFVGAHKDGGTEFSLSPPLAELRSGDAFQIRLSILEGCHLYVLFLGSQGETAWLFPSDGEVALGRWCDFGGRVVLPGPKDMNVLDEVPGRELVAVIAAAGPVQDADQLPDLVRAKGETLGAEALKVAGSDRPAQVILLSIDHKP